MKIVVVKAAPRQFGFTLIEMLLVIAIIGILAGLAVPALKNLGKSNVTVSASRQLLDDVGRARQLAMNNHTTVYMVFVPPSFWNNLNYNNSATYNNWWNNLSVNQQTAVTNLCDKQYAGYTFISLRSVGDQPGRTSPRYLASWQALPEGVFIGTNKFSLPGIAISSTNISIAPALYDSWNQDYPHSGYNTVYAFTNMVAIPFPTQDSPNPISMPALAFNYLGQLTFDGVTAASQDAYIPLARGVVAPAINPSTKAFVLTSPPSVTETPVGNSTDISYNIIHIDALTGRAVLEFHKIP